jgi:hypothetical protein
MNASGHRMVTDWVLRMSNYTSDQSLRAAVVEESAKADEYRDLELVDVEGASSNPRDNPHKDAPWYVADDIPRYSHSFPGLGTFCHAAFNQFIDIKKGPGEFDDYDGYSYRKGSASRGEYELVVGQRVDEALNWWLNDEYVHVPGQPWYRGCSPSVERYSFPTDRGIHSSVEAELLARFPLAVSQGASGKGVPYSVFMPVDNLARYWYNINLFANFPLALGPVMHAIQDVSIPHHTAGLNGNWHRAYEDDVNNNIEQWLGDPDFRNEAKALSNQWYQAAGLPPQPMNYSDCGLIPSPGWSVDALVTWLALNAYREYDQTYGHFHNGYQFNAQSARELTKLAAAMGLFILTKATYDKFAILLVGLAGNADLRGIRASMRAFNYPNFFIRHSNFLGEITAISSDLDRNDATFRVVWGLADPNSTFSLESINYPGYYLRHSNFRLRLDPYTEEPLFKADATFRLQPGLANPIWSSFDSYNYPGYYIRHRDFHLYLEPKVDAPKSVADLFRQDATFLIRAPYVPN